jgi:hypothetical protein
MPCIRDEAQPGVYVLHHLEPARSSSCCLNRSRFAKELDDILKGMEPMTSVELVE